MLRAAIIAHATLGAFLAFFFILYYVKGDGKWKVLFEAIIGIGGNAGIVFTLDRIISIKDGIIRMYSVASCFFAFLLVTAILLIVVSFLIKDHDGRDIIRLRDILLGQYSFINEYYKKRSAEIDDKLSIKKLEARETAVSRREAELESERRYISGELEKIEKLGKNKLKFKLPENKNITVNQEYIETMPSYIADTFTCISDINSCTNSLLAKPKESINISSLKSYFYSVATYISSDLFGGTTTDARIHFRIYDKKVDGYVKFVAVMGSKLITNDMTIIPYNDDSMIRKSFECKHALIKSINITHDFQSENHNLWQDYITYTFYGLTYDDKPYLSFGISVKNAERYKKALHFINYFRLENFLQDNIERVNDAVSIASILYGGSGNA